MAERGLCTGEINCNIHDTIAVVIEVRQEMGYFHDCTVPIAICTKSGSWLESSRSRSLQVKKRAAARLIRQRHVKIAACQMLA